MKVGERCRFLISGNVYKFRNMTNPHRIGEVGILTCRKYVRSHTRVCVCVCVFTLRYKPVGSLGFFIDKSLRPHYGPGVDSTSARNEYQGHLLGSGVKAVGA